MLPICTSYGFYEKEGRKPIVITKIENRFEEIRAGGVTLPGTLTLPRRARGLVVFVHGSGSSRLSPRNQHVAEYLQKAGLGTLLFDLLSQSEEQIDRDTAALQIQYRLVGRTYDRCSGLAITAGFQYGLETGTLRSKHWSCCSPGHRSSPACSYRGSGLPWWQA